MRGSAAAWLRWVVLVALVLAAYGAAVRADFVNWDDPYHVYENPRVVGSDDAWVLVHVIGVVPVDEVGAHGRAVRRQHERHEHYPPQPRGRRPPHDPDIVPDGARLPAVGGTR